ncbi:alpha/beta fold hydrolase [Corynebacterium sp.]|uniref:esterase/lipase family protein n=1 Tax=Corynebacterium sp. TaxID=1720 RepID=UPI0028AEA514|nr:alpha/beta fold hydrolase [Corynebacterium sp.]
MSSPSNTYASSSTPEHRFFLTAFLKSWGHADPMPAGVNDWDTPLSEEHPVPVVLLHGTWMNAYGTWSMIAPKLAARGFRVFALNYGSNDESLLGRRTCCFGNGGLLDATAEIGEFIDTVLERTGASQVDVIGHSQGSAQARMIVTENDGRFAGGEPKIRNIIGLAGSGHGTTMMGLGTFAAWLRDKLHGKIDVAGLLRSVLGQCAEDQIVDSDVVRYINRDGDTVPGVHYTMIGTRYDEVVTPWRTQFLTPGEGATVRNFCVQSDGNARDWSDHLSLCYSPRTFDLILERLSDSDNGSPGDYRKTHPHVIARVIPVLGQLRQRGY